MNILKYPKYPNFFEAHKHFKSDIINSYNVLSNPDYKQKYVIC